MGGGGGGGGGGGLGLIVVAVGMNFRTLDLLKDYLHYFPKQSMNLIPTLFYACIMHTPLIWTFRMVLFTLLCFLCFTIYRMNGITHILTILCYMNRPKMARGFPL